VEATALPKKDVWNQNKADFGELSRAVSSHRTPKKASGDSRYLANGNGLSGTSITRTTPIAAISFKAFGDLISSGTSLRSLWIGEWRHSAAYGRNQTESGL
jgi:hypothetical protein